MKNEIVAAAKPVGPRTSDGGAWRKTIGGIASALSAALALNCPACIPALSALLSSLGVGFAFVRWVLILLLLIGVASIAWAAKRHGRWWVLGAGIFGAALIYSGRYVWFSPALVWTGAAGMIGASLANCFFKRACCRCAQAESKL